MRLELLYNPKLIVERLASEIKYKSKLSKVRQTSARGLSLDYLGTLELVELLECVSHPKIIYDIGAYKGTWSLMAQAITKCEIIHAFEPLKMHVDQLYPGVGQNQNIIFHNVAVGSVPGNQEINITNRSDASSLLLPTDKVLTQYEVAKIESESVKVVTLDSYVSDNNLQSPDLIKLDVQGYELEVLKGALNCISQATWILCEVSFQEYYLNQPLFHEIAAFLHNLNYSIYAFGSDTPLGQCCKQTDILFHRNS
jgi:FkbM family methyltransferase